MHRRFHPGDVPLPADSGTRDLAEFEKPTTQPALDFPVGQTFECDAFLQSRQTLTSCGRIRRAEANIPFVRRRRRCFGPPSGAGAWSAIRPTALLGFQSLRRFAPDAGGTTSPSAGPACCFADRSPRLIFVAGSVVLKGKLDLKKTNDHELVVAASRLHSGVRSAPRGFLSARARSCHGLCLSQDFGHDIACIPRGHDPAWIISLRKPFPAPIRSWVLRQTSNEMISWPIARCSLRGALPRRSATQALRRSPVHPCRAAASGVGTAAAIAGPFSVFKGLMPRRPDVGCVALWATHPASRRLPV
jgi:hypothetical protein